MFYPITNIFYFIHHNLSCYISVIYAELYLIYIMSYYILQSCFIILISCYKKVCSYDIKTMLYLIIMFYPICCHVTLNYKYIMCYHIDDIAKSYCYFYNVLSYNHVISILLLCHVISHNVIRLYLIAIISCSFHSKWRRWDIDKFSSSCSRKSSFIFFSSQHFKNKTSCKLFTWIYRIDRLRMSFNKMEKIIFT